MEPAYVAVAAIIYIVFIKLVYNNYLAEPGDEVGDLVILKTIVMGVAAAGASVFIMNKYHAVRLPWQDVTPVVQDPVPAAAAVASPLRAHKITSLVPQ